MNNNEDMDAHDAELDRIEAALDRLEEERFNTGYNDGLAAMGRDLQNASTFRIRALRKLHKFVK